MTSYGILTQVFHNLDRYYSRRGVGRVAGRPFGGGIRQQSCCNWKWRAPDTPPDHRRMAAVTLVTASFPLRYTVDKDEDDNVHMRLPVDNT